MYRPSAKRCQTLRFHWFLPTGGDSRHLVAGSPGVGTLSARGDRPATLDYLSQITRGAEQLGLHGVVAPSTGGRRTPG